MNEPLYLYAVSFIASRDGIERVVVLHASGPDDALYCIRKGWGRIRQTHVTRIDDLEVGVMRPVYERKPKE